MSASFRSGSSYTIEELADLVRSTLEQKDMTLRKLAAQDLTDRPPGWSLDVLTGALRDGPTDLSLHHDEYLGEPDE
jgi:hypothetical protein